MKKAICAVVAVFMMMALCACSQTVVGKSVKSAEDLSGARVGVLADSDASGLFSVVESFGATVSEYSSMESLAANLKTGEIDCIITDKVTGEKLARKTSGIKALDQLFLNERYSIAIAKENSDLTAEIDSAILQLEESDTFQKIVDGYIKGTDYRYESTLDRENAKGCLTLAVAPDNSPYAYKNEEGEYTGIDIDAARAVCDILNIDFEVREEAADELIVAVQSGRADFAMGRLVDNEENGEMVDFSRGYMTSTQIMIVRSK